MFLSRPCSCSFHIRTFPQLLPFFFHTPHFSSHAPVLLLANSFKMFCTEQVNVLLSAISCNLTIGWHYLSPPGTAAHTAYSVSVPSQWLPPHPSPRQQWSAWAVCSSVCAAAGEHLSRKMWVLVEAESELPPDSVEGTQHDNMALFSYECAKEGRVAALQNASGMALKHSKWCAVC